MLYFVTNNKTFLGHPSPPKIFGFRNMTNAVLVKKHVRYLPSMDNVEEMTCSRFLIKTHYNTANNIKPHFKNIVITSKTLYEASLICDMNNVSLSIVNHVYERDDGDIELLCTPMKQFHANNEFARRNLEFIFRNSNL